MKLAAFQATQNYNLAKTVLTGAGAGPMATPAPQAGEVKQNPAFEAVHNLAKTVAQGEQAGQALLTGNADPHSVVQAMAAAELAVETAVTVRDKVVEAYQELIRMPV